MLRFLQVDSLDLNTMSWSTLGSMSTHRHGLGVVVLEGPLYAVGGHDGKIPTFLLTRHTANNSKFIL